MKAKQPKTAAERMQKYRASRAAAFSQNLRTAYLKGFDDAAAGKEPAQAETWKDKNAAIAYICGGFDGTNNKI